jgi:hypothetical protein
VGEPEVLVLGSRLVAESLGMAFEMGLEQAPSLIVPERIRV